MRIEFGNTVIIIADWVFVALILIFPSLIFSRRGRGKGLVKFLMLWSFFNCGCLFSYMLFSNDPFAGFAIFHVLGFFLSSLVFYQLWKNNRRGRK